MSLVELSEDDALVILRCALLKDSYLDQEKENLLLLAVWEQLSDEGKERLECLMKAAP